MMKWKVLSMLIKIQTTLWIWGKKISVATFMNFVIFFSVLSVAVCSVLFYLLLLHLLNSIAVIGWDYFAAAADIPLVCFLNAGVCAAARLTFSLFFWTWRVRTWRTRWEARHPQRGSRNALRWTSVVVLCLAVEVSTRPMSRSKRSALKAGDAGLSKGGLMESCERRVGITTEGVVVGRDVGEIRSGFAFLISVVEVTRLWVISVFWITFSGSVVLKNPGCFISS